MERFEDAFSAYRQIFWSIVLLLFHVNIGSVKLLPDFIVFSILFSGIYFLRSFRESKNLKRATLISGVLISISFIEFLMSLSGLSFPLRILFMGIQSVLIMIVFYDIFIASIDILREIGDERFALETEKHLLIFLVLFTIASVARIGMLILPEITVFVVLTWGGLILQIWLAILFSNLKKRFSPGQL